MNKLIAVPVNANGVLDAHFGHCKFFELFQTEGETIVSIEKVVPPPHEPGVLPKWLAEKGATDIIAGGLGERAIQIFKINNVNVFVGAPKLSAAELVLGFLEKTITYDANYCDH